MGYRLSHRYQLPPLMFDREEVEALLLGARMVSSWGDMDMAIAIRTALLRDGQLHVQAGAGVVADSDPALEYEETRNKALALLRAAEIAAAGLEAGSEASQDSQSGRAA